MCALDVLSVAGLVNYFGKVHLASDEQASDPTSDGMQIKPVLLQKGKTRLAMYGVGNIKDARMHYELRSNRVRMFMPEEDEDSKWFNMLLIHQNRYVCVYSALLYRRTDPILTQSQARPAEFGTRGHV